MDIWEELYQRAKKEYHPEDVTPFVYAHHVVCALESEDGTIYTGFCIEACSGVMNLCAERVAALNMYVNSGQTKIKRLIAFQDKAPSGGGSGMCYPQRNDDELLGKRSLCRQLSRSDSWCRDCYAYCKNAAGS